MNFEKIYRVYFDDVYYFLLSLSKDEEVAKDLTSETFFKVLKNIENFQGKSSLKTYIFQIGKNSYFDYLKRTKREVDISKIENQLESDEDLEIEFINREGASILSREIENLKEPQRSIVKFRIFEELSFKEIGKLYGKSENWACVTFYRSKTKLKEILEKKGYNE